MLTISHEPLLTPRLELRRTRIDDAAAMFDALSDPAMYAFIPRNAPTSVADVEARFARVMQETATDRAERWLNWTVWLRENGAAIGMTEATVSASGKVSIGYLFDPRIWRRGYGREAVAAMVSHLTAQGATEIEATIDVRNTGSRALVAALGFTHIETKGADEIWRLG